MGLKKFRELFKEDDSYINISIVCNELLDKTAVDYNYITNPRIYTYDEFDEQDCNKINIF